jgi:hypothetical protein
MSLGQANSMRHTRVLAATALLLFGATTVHAQRGRGDDQGRGRGRGDDQGRGRGREDQPDHARQLSPQEQQQRINEERQRQADYQQRLDQQVRAAQAQAARLQTQRRNAQYAQQQRYLQTLQEQQRQLQATRDYSRDPAYTTAPSYRYNLGGTYHQTNQYGVNVLKQAVNDGYQQGVQAGQADRADRAPSNYQRSFAYQDANYGYNGNYVPQTDYNYYFRQGFRRGYQDGYATRAQYGTVSTGNVSILSSILSSILGLQSIP